MHACMYFVIIVFILVNLLKRNKKSASVVYGPTLSLRGFLR